MSNVIKAVNIRYKDDRKALDFNETAEGFVRLYAENLAKAEEIEAGDPEYVDPEDLPEGDGLPEDGLLEDGEDVREPEPEIKHHATKSNGRGRDEEAAALSAEELESVREECERLKNETRSECDKIIEETRLSLEAEKEELFRNAEENGYRSGEEKARAEYDALNAELKEKIESIDKEFEKKVDELEPAFVDLTIKLIQKITGILVDERRDLILHIIRQSILGMENSNNYIIHVSKDDFDFVNSKKQELLYELKGNFVEVIEDPVLTRAQCTIETDTRIFDCSLDVQLKNLIANIKLLSGQ